MADTTPPFQRFQRQFLANLRDPRRHAAPPGVPASRMRLYQTLLYNKIEDSLLACFPVTRALLGKRRWARLVKSFIAGHRCVLPCYRQIPDEFVAYLENRPALDGEPPFLAELAHYEWIELVLTVAEEEPGLPTMAPGGDLLAGRPVFAPVMRLLSYRYPVHRIAPGKPGWARWNKIAGEAATEPTFILGFRTPEDDVSFIELNPAAARLVDLLQTTGSSGLDALKRLAAEADYPDIAAFVSFGAEILQGLKNQSAILGAAPRFVTPSKPWSKP
ncbi:MAG: putative DNA-binding domain-containing protein [Methylococcaceae bacterium]|nr:putative DNA-binding domain-containing protein [Methylococcaceae bacterium]